MRQPYIIYRRPDGARKGKVYYAAFWDEDRQRYGSRRSTGQVKPAAAHAQARKWLEEGVPSRKAETFGSYLKGFWAPDGDHARARELAGRPLSAAYLVANQGAIDNYVLPYLEKAGKERMPLARVTRGLIEAILRHLADTTDLSAGRINGIRKAVTVPLARAYELGRIPRNPGHKVLSLKERKVKRQILTPEEARAFFALPWADERLRLVNGLAASTGLRLGECRGLQKEDLRKEIYREDKKRAYYWIALRHNWQDREGLKHLKSDYEKIGNEEAYEEIPLGRGIGEGLFRLVQTNPWGNSFVFYGYTRDRPLSKTKIEEAFIEAVHGIGISEEERRRRRLSFHAWRHWYNTMTRGKVPDHLLRRITRHKTAEMTERYTGRLTPEQRQAVSELGESLF